MGAQWKKWKGEFHGDASRLLLRAIGPVSEWLGLKDMVEAQISTSEAKSVFDERRILAQACRAIARNPQSVAQSLGREKIVQLAKLQAEVEEKQSALNRTKSEIKHRIQSTLAG